MNDLDLTEFLDEYRAEANEHLHALNDQLLKLERDPGDQGPIREMFLSAHTIKGGAAMLDLGDVRVLAHALEEVLAGLRDGERQLAPGTADLLFRALDLLRERNETTAPGRTADEQVLDMTEQLCAEHVEPAPVPERNETPRTGSDACRVLLVEDSSTVRLMESMMLTEAGFEVDPIGDGREALDRAIGGQYDLVVTGMETRGLRGPELAARLRALPAYAHVPIIVMSADDNAEDRHRAAEASVDAYIRKGTFGQHRLVEAARELVTTPPLHT